MELKNGVTTTKEYFIIQDKGTGWYVSNRAFGNGGLNHVSFTPHKENADKFTSHEVDQRVIDSIIHCTDFDLKVIKVTKTIIEFENEEEV